MRPYMLWLTRVYGGAIRGYGTAFMTWPNVLDDWLRRCAEDRYRNERARPRGPHARNHARNLARRTDRTNRSRPHVGDLP